MAQAKAIDDEDREEEKYPMGGGDGIFIFHEQQGDH